MIYNNEEYKIIKQSQLTAEFNGFDSEMSFHLDDGSFYYQAEYKYHYHYAYRPPVQILSSNNAKYISVVGMNDMVRVEETNGFISRIAGEFNGWDGNTIFNLSNGQVWQQDKYGCKTFHANRPEVQIVKVGGKFIMTVRGRSIKVKRTR